MAGTEPAHLSPSGIIGPLHRQGECVPTATGWSCWPKTATGATPPPNVLIDRDLEVFRITAEHFRHDLSALWTHSSYFLIIQGALFSVFANLIGPSDKATAGLVSQSAEAALVACVGITFGLFWAWVSWRRIVLINVWRANVMHLSGVVDRHGAYLRTEQPVGAHWWYGPSAFTARLPWLILLLWVGATILVVLN